MSQSYYVYALLDSGDLGPFRYGHRKFTCQPFYIGKGKNLRHTKHEETAFKRADGNYISQTHKSRKIRKIHREGNEVVCKIVAKDLSESEAFNLEKSLILKIGRSDLKEGPLTNKTDGGEGLTRIKTKKRTRELLSISASLQQMSYTETRKKEIKAKISATVKTYAANLPRSAIDERVAKMLETNAHQSTVKKARRTAKLSRSMVEACSRKTAKAKKASQSNLVKSKWREDEDKVSEWKFQLSKTLKDKHDAMSDRKKKALIKNQRTGMAIYYANRTPDQIQAASDARKRSWEVRRANKEYVNGRNSK